MKSTIGPSIEAKLFAQPDSDVVLKNVLDLGCNAIQIHGHSNLVGLDIAHPELVRQFAYRAIHLPELHGPGKDENIIKAAKKVGETIAVHAYVLHPTGLESFGWLDDEFGDQLCIENMDWRKDFGKSPEDIANVFRELPQVEWTFDVNHIMTNDSGMHLADSFYEQFSDRLANYHLSGFVGENLPHTLLCDTHQDEIIAKVTDLSKPIILESFDVQALSRLPEELDYVAARLQ